VGGFAVGCTSFNRQGSTTCFQLRDSVIGDGKPLFFRQPFLQPADDLAERLNAKAIAYLSTSPWS
jgi:hypothetical protein